MALYRLRENSIILGTKVLLKLAADSVRDVNKQRDKNGITYARKAMIRCGLVLDLCGEWRVQQLRPELQRIISTYPKHFDGTFDCSDSSTDGWGESANSLNSEDRIDAP
jgi:hypothetical protein